MKSTMVTNPSTIDCTRCHAPIDALRAPWCEEVNLTCELCGQCLCHAPEADVSRFWAMAAAEVAVRRANERKQRAGSKSNREEPKEWWSWIRLTAGLLREALGTRAA